MGETLTPQTEWQIEETDMPSGGIRYEEELAINNEGCESDDSEREGAASFDTAPVQTTRRDASSFVP